MHFKRDAANSFQRLEGTEGASQPSVLGRATENVSAALCPPTAPVDWAASESGAQVISREISGRRG